MDIGWAEILVLFFIFLGVLAAFVTWLVRHSGASARIVSLPLDIARERYARGEISKKEFDSIKNVMQPVGPAKVILPVIVTLISVACMVVVGTCSLIMSNVHPGPVFNIGNNFPQKVTVFIDALPQGTIGRGQTKIFYPQEINNPEYPGPNILVELKSVAGTVLYSRLFSPEEYQAVLENVKGTPYWIGSDKNIGIYLADTGERILSQDDIKAYWSNSHSIELNFGGIIRWNSYIDMTGIPKLAQSLFSREFIIKLNDTEICRGEFYSVASSSTFKGIAIIDALFPLDSAHDQLWIISDYPGMTLGPDYAGVASDLEVAFAEMNLLR
jgi:hypothetical protein